MPFQFDDEEGGEMANQDQGKIHEAIAWIDQALRDVAHTGMDRFPEGHRLQESLLKLRAQLLKVMEA